MRRRATAAVVVALAASAAAVALHATVTGEPHVRVDAEPGGQVRWVLPGSPLWELGVRPGQRVLQLEPGESLADWRLVTETEDGPVHARFTGIQRGVVDTFPLALLAAALSALAVLAFRRRVAAAAGLSACACFVASFPIGASGHPIWSSLALLLAFLAPVTWLIVWGPLRDPWRPAVAIAALGLGAGWLVCRFLAVELFETVELARAVSSGGATMVMAVSLLQLRRWRALLEVDLRTSGDVLVLALLAATASYLVLGAGVPPLLVASAAGVTLLLYPRWRGLVGRGLNRLVLGEIRERATIQAIEDERGRLARELHDEPLQQLAGLIRRLDQRPDSALETQELRDVAGRLRRLTTELRPPVLDDLGLGPALTFLVDQANVEGGEVHVVAELDDTTGLSRDDRPPAEVELAFFRIAQEAVGNAQVHSRGSVVRLAGSVSPGEVQLVVEDDGVGIDDAAVQRAQRQGRFGLHSMAQRAALVGARLSVERGQTGTRVTASWAAPE